MNASHKAIQYSRREKRSKNHHKFPLGLQWC